MRRLRARTYAALSALMLLLIAFSGSALAFLDDPAAYDVAISILRSKLGPHARVLKIEIARDGVSIEAQDPSNRNHIDRWRYGTVVYLKSIPVKRLTGPESIDPTLINPDLEANLFNLDSVDLSAKEKLIKAALARARLEDPAVVTRIEIQRQVFILPSPSSGDVRWTVSIDSGRERATVYANARGEITGADLGGTRRARTLNIIDSPEYVAEAAAAFRQIVSSDTVLVRVGVEPKSVGFSTNMRDDTIKQLGIGLPSSAVYTWDLNGLQRRLGRVDVSLERAPAGAAFAIADVDWTIAGNLARDALAKAALPKAKVTRLEVAKTTDGPGGPVLAWTVEILEPSGEITKIIADPKGGIQRVVLPDSRRPKPNWLDAATIAQTIARVPATFGKDVKIASLIFDERGGRITVDDPARGNPATFDFSADSVARSTISFSLDSMGPRFSVSELMALDEKKLAALQSEAMKRLSGNKTVYLESVSIGAHPFVRKAGGRVIEVRIRDRAQDSVGANYAWIVFDFDGRALDASKF